MSGAFLSGEFAVQSLSVCSLAKIFCLILSSLKSLSKLSWKSLSASFTRGSSYAFAAFLNLSIWSPNFPFSLIYLSKFGFFNAKLAKALLIPWVTCGLLLACLSRICNKLSTNGLFAFLSKWFLYYPLSVI